LSSFDTGNVTDMNYMFRECTSLTSLDLSGFNTANVTTMGWMFEFCNALTYINLSSFNTGGVTRLGLMFKDCSSLTTLDLSGFNTANVANMDLMFSGCNSLTTIYVSSGWTTASVTDGASMFTNCTALVGGRGTVYDADYTDYTYAHIDGGTANPGYLTPKSGYGAAAVPTFTRVNNNKVLVSSETEGAIIRYTLDGTEPDSTSTVYSDSIGVDRNLTIKAYAARQNFTDSEVATYMVDWFKVSDVEFVQTGNQVALSTATPDADIHYTLSTETGAPEHDYDGTPLTMSGDCIITAWATLEGYTPSEQTEFEFHADGVTCSNPVFARNGNVIKITTVTEQVQIFYTTNGTEPTEQSTLYADSILVDHNMVIKAIAMRQNYYPSQVISFTVDWFKADMPTFLWTNDQLSLSTATEGGDIYYTIAANASSVSAPQQYSGAITVTQDAMITAWTQRQGWNNSDTLVIDYPYTAWVALLDAVNAAKDVIVLATGNDNVPQQMLNELQTLVAEAEAMYQARTAARTEVEDVTGSLNEQTAAVNQLATAVDEAYAVLTENNTVLTFYYDKKMQERNGMGVGPFSTEVERGWSTDPSAITTVVFDETFAGYTALSSTAYWFEHCSNLSTITGLPSLNTANVTDMSYMFDGCSVLASIDVSNFNTSKVTDMSRMFSSCYALQTLNLSSFNTLNVTSMKDLFAGCSSLASVNLSSFTTTNVSDMHSMFYGCTALQSLDLTSFNTAIVIDMENMFANSYSLNTIYVSGDWNTDAVSNGSSMFTDCIALVGGRGTVYDANHTDAAYARIDMAPDAPGYFTRKTQQMGDANDDGAVTVEDAVATVTNILGEPTVSYFSQTKADMNNDSLIDIFDVTLIVNAVFAATPAPAYSMAGSIAAEDVRLTAQSNRMYMGIDKEGRFTAFQFDVTLPEGTELEGVSLASASTNHQLSFQKRQGNTYRVIGLSMTNEQLAAANGRLVQLQLSDNAGEKNVKMSNVIFVGQPATDATAIRNYVSDGAADRDAIYDLNGRYVGTDKSRLTKGIYIINHKKVNIK
jgi:surface protein